MQFTKKTMNALYENLGKLFYAVAMSDGHVHVKEWDTVKEIVRDRWLAVDDFTDRFGTDAAHHIEIVFDGLMDYEGDSAECFDEFKEFYRAHPHAFTDQIKSLALQTSHDIAHSSARQNKSETMILANLRLLFEGKIK